MGLAIGVKIPSQKLMIIVGRLPMSQLSQLQCLLQLLLQNGSFKHEIVENNSTVSQLSWDIVKQQAITISMTLSVCQCYYCPFTTYDEDQYVRHGVKNHLYLPIFPGEGDRLKKKAGTEIIIQFKKGTTMMKIIDIKVGDLGDIKTLAKSIQEIGLLHPIVVNQYNELVAGQRKIRSRQAK